MPVQSRDYPWPTRQLPPERRIDALVTLLRQLVADIYGLFNTGVVLSSNSAVVAGVTVGASPYTYTNAAGYAEYLVVSAGAVTSLVLLRRGVPTTLGVTAGAVILTPVDALKVTFTSTPAVIKVPL